MMIHLFRAGFIAICMALAACSGEPGGESFETKRAYSVLQGERYRLEQSKSLNPYVFTRNALGSEYDTIALRLNGSEDYFVMIANAMDDESVLTLSEHHNISITNEIFREIDSLRILSHTSRKFLQARVSNNADPLTQ